MSSAWHLPEHLADVLPSEAKRIEGLRRSWTDEAAGYGYELVIPPLVEHLDSLLSGTGRSMGLQTFKLVDQLSGRTLGLRADTTPQAARIDAHLLNRAGVVRLCYCGPVVHTRPAGPWMSREPLQFGAEIFGHAGLEADLEAIELAIDGLRQCGVPDLVLDVGHARVLGALLERVLPPSAPAEWRQSVADALSAKDGAALDDALQAVWSRHPELQQGDEAKAAAQALHALLRCFGDVSVLTEAAALLPSWPAIGQALNDLTWIVSHVRHTHPDVSVVIDLADAGGQDYYTGIRFALMSAAHHRVLARGGRYDHVGRVFGRERPAVGFSLDLKVLSGALDASGPAALPRAAILAPWSEDPALRAAVRSLRARGETVVCALPGHENEAQEYACDRSLLQVGDQWVLQAL